MMKKKKTDWSYYVGWIVFWCAAAGILGIVIQLIRFGTLVESGGIGPTGF